MLNLASILITHYDGGNLKQTKRLGENDGFLTSLLLVFNYYKDNVRNQ